jgi:F-type H+/Na+-transporting ATPase subunit alpha
MNINNKQSSKREVGYCISAQYYILNLEGLPGARVNDIIESETGARAIVSTLDSHKVEALMLDNEQAKPGDCFTLTGKRLSIPIHVNLLGRIINPLGMPIDGKGNFPPGGEEIDLDKVAPGIDARAVITEQFRTGITVIDTLVPIGIGQRELVFGEPRSGKSSFLLDVVLNQKGQNRICIYNVIGRSDMDLKKIKNILENNGGMEFTVVIAATSSQMASLISIAPSVACAVAEFYRNQGKDVLLVLDDLGSHAKYLREINLLSNHIPGRESYPADIFYSHSRLVERAGSFNKNYGGGKITLLPVIETDMENFTGLIPTNVMSMTDGHLLFTQTLRAQGHYPAVEVDRSVTRVGRQTQFLMHKILSDKVRSLMAYFHEVEQLGKFGSELSAETQLTIKRGIILMEIIRQEPRDNIDPITQILYLALIFTGFYDVRDLEFAKQFREKILSTLSTHNEFLEIGKNINKIKYEELIEKLKPLTKLLNDVCK